MALLCQEAEPKGQETLGSPRCPKDLIEELFERRRDLFTEVDLVFFDTTSRKSRQPVSLPLKFKLCSEGLSKGLHNATNSRALWFVTLSG
jgi:hypothetical protein